MNRLSFDQIKEEISKNLSVGEEIESIGIFKKVPSTSWLLLTRGMVWFLTQEFHVAVTNQRLVILPVAKKISSDKRYEDAIYANFDEVHLYEGPLKNTMLDIRKTYKGAPLNLRFKPDCIPEGIDLYQFIAALNQKSAA